MKRAVVAIVIRGARGRPIVIAVGGGLEPALEFGEIEVEILVIVVVAAVAASTGAGPFSLRVAATAGIAKAAAVNAKLRWSRKKTCSYRHSPAALS